MSRKSLKVDNSQFPIILMVVKNFSASCDFWITVGRANNEQSNFFLEQNQIWRVYHWLQRQQMVTLVKLFETGYKETSLGLKRSALTGTTKASRKLPAGAGKFPTVTCGNRGNRYLRRFLLASAGNFTCGTVYLRPSQVNLHAPILQCDALHRRTAVTNR